MTLADRIIEQGPYAGGDPSPFANLDYTDLNRLRDELIAGRRGMTGYEAWRVIAGFGEKLVTHEYSAAKYGDPERLARADYAFYVDLAAKGGFSWHVGPHLQKRIVVTEWTEVDT